MAQKIIKVGNSAAVTIPEKSLQDLGLSIGDSIVVETGRDRKTIVIQQTESTIDPELFMWTKKFIEKYKEDLKKLKDK